jgi:hypothetical protein
MLMVTLRPVGQMADAASDDLRHDALMLRTADFDDAIVQPELINPSGRLDLRRDRERICLFTGARSVRQSQRMARVAGILVMVTGAWYMTVTPWSAALVGLGLIVLIAGPHRIRPEMLLEVDLGADQLVLTQDVVVAGERVEIQGVQAIHGRYATKGWDGYSLIHAVTRDGSELPLVMLRGTDEQLAEEVCRTLGALLGLPASYAGPFGTVRSWEAGSAGPGASAAAVQLPSP